MKNEKILKEWMEFAEMLNYEVKNNGFPYGETFI